MPLVIFLCGLLMLGLGGFGMRSLPESEALALLQGALLLGGGLIICSLFSLKMKWHGLTGAGVLALLGAARGIGNLPDLVRWLSGDRSRGIAPALELGFTLLCLLLLALVLRTLQRERIRRMLETDR